MNVFCLFGPWFQSYPKIFNLKLICPICKFNQLWSLLKVKSQNIRRSFQWRYISKWCCAINKVHVMTAQHSMRCKWHFNWLEPTHTNPAPITSHLTLMRFPKYDHYLDLEFQAIIYKMHLEISSGDLHYLKNNNSNFSLINFSWSK